MRATAIWILGCLTAFAFLTQTSLAGDDVPVVSLRIASYDRLNKAAAQLLKLAGNEIQPTFDHPAAEHLYGIAEFDGSRPTSFELAFPQQPDDLKAELGRLSVWIVPVTHAGRKLQFSFEFNSKTGIAARPKAKKVADNLYRWDQPDQASLYVRTEGDFAYIGEDAELIERVRRQHDRAAPKELDQDLISMELRWSEAPTAWKQRAAKVAFDLISDKEHLANQSLGFALMLFWNDVETLKIGFNVSPDDGRAGFQICLVAKPDSSLDQSFAVFSRQPTRFAHLLKDGASMNLVLSLRFPDAVKKSLKESEKQFQESDLYKNLLEKSGDAKTSMKEFLESFASVFRLWTVTGQLDTAWTIQDHAGRKSLFAGWYALGAQNLEEPTRGLAIKLTKSNLIETSEVEFADGRRAYRMTRDEAVSFTEDEVYLVSGTHETDALRQVVRTDDSDRPQRAVPSVLLEADADFAIQLLKGFRASLPESFRDRLPRSSVTGRLRFAIERGDREVTASVNVDEPLLREIVAPPLRGLSQQLQQGLSQALREALWPQTMAEPQPADAADPANAK